MFKQFLIIIILIATLKAVRGQDNDNPKWNTWATWGDQNNGTYRNPVLPADYSDLDCIRVGDDYYAISSTFQYSPGMIILHSKDLVNWTIKGHAVPDVSQISSYHCHAVAFAGAADGGRPGGQRRLDWRGIG